MEIQRCAHVLGMAVTNASGVDVEILNRLARGSVAALFATSVVEEYGAIIL
jgi:hypothetical protein